MMLFSSHIDVIIIEARIVDYFRDRFKQRRDRLKHGRYRASIRAQCLLRHHSR
ncbi:hypothetical protein GNT65_18280 [Shewanella sp. JBTF-M18]|uniref:Uncharacterized protein n=1 Tax=Shewanella insulae TaxID=2681496 RepID=A0A6L7I5H7_9GAMM|nr:hypothetical protein [Shewanella insulae]